MGRLFGWFLLAVASLFYLRRWWRRAQAAPGAGERPSRAPVRARMVQDPQCRTYIPESTALRKRVEGESVAFCSVACYEAYVREHWAH